jgi:hypothetical protein
MAGQSQPSRSSQRVASRGTPQQADAARATEPTTGGADRLAYIDAVAVAFATRVVATFLLGVLIVLSDSVLIRIPRDDAFTVIGVAGVGALLVGSGVGARYAGLAGWRSLLAVVVLAVIAELTFAVVADVLTEATGVEVLGGAAYYVLLAGIAGWLIWRRRRRTGEAT